MGSLGRIATCGSDTDIVQPGVQSMYPIHTTREEDTQANTGENLEIDGDDLTTKREASSNKREPSTMYDLEKTATERETSTAEDDSTDEGETSVIRRPLVEGVRERGFIVVEITRQH